MCRPAFSRDHSLTAYSHRRFKQQLFMTTKDTMVSSIHDIVNRDRQGGRVDRSVLCGIETCTHTRDHKHSPETCLRLLLHRSIAKNAIDMFLVMGVCDREDLKMLRNDRETEAKIIQGAVAVNEAFITDFEQPFAQHTAAYYRTEANLWIVMDDIASFLIKVWVFFWRGACSCSWLSRSLRPTCYPRNRSQVQMSINEEDERCKAYLPQS